MNAINGAIVLVAALTVAGCTTCSQPDSDGWKDVFDKGLANAEMDGGSGWRYDDDGFLTPTNKSKILSRESYGPNFDLDCVYKLGSAGNSGLYIYDSDHPKAKIEIQMLDDFHPQYQGKQKRHQMTGSLYGHSAATKVCSKPAGEWNRMQVSCRGKSVKVWVNGEQVIDEDLSKFVDAVRNPDGTETPLAQRTFMPWAQIPTRGKVGFQGVHGGGAVFVKSFRIREVGK